MKKILTLTASFAALGLVQSAFAGDVMLHPAPAPAPADSALTGDLSLGYDSQYSFRGVTGLVVPEADHAVTAAINLAYAVNDQWSLVGGVTIQTVNSKVANFDNYTYRGGVHYKASSFSAEIGYQGFDGLLSPVTISAQEASSEIYVNLGTTTPFIGGTTNLFVAHDIDKLEGTYIELSFNKGYEICDSVGVDVTVGGAYSLDYWKKVTTTSTPIGTSRAIATSSDLNHVYITLGLPWQAVGDLMVTPHVTYSKGLAALNPAGPGSEDSEVIYGIKASIGF